MSRVGLVVLRLVHIAIAQVVRWEVHVPCGTDGSLVGSSRGRTGGPLADSCPVWRGSRGARGRLQLRAARHRVQPQVPRRAAHADVGRPDHDRARRGARPRAHPAADRR